MQNTKINFGPGRFHKYKSLEGTNFDQVLELIATLAIYCPKPSELNDGDGAYSNLIPLSRIRVPHSACSFLMYLATSSGLPFKGVLPSSASLLNTDWF